MIIRIAALAPVVLLTGCAMQLTSPGAAKLAAAREPAASALEIETAKSENQFLPAQPLTPDDAVRIAMIQSPKIGAALARAGVARADFIEAALPPNPRLTFQSRWPRGGGSPEIELELVGELTRHLMLPQNKRMAAREFAAAQAEAAGAVLDVASATREAWHELVCANKVAELSRHAAAAGEAAAELARRQEKAGTQPRRFVAETEVEAETLMGASAQATAEATAARARLNALMGFEKDEAWTIPEDMPPLPASDPDAEVVQRRALEMRLDLAAAREREAAFKDAAEWQRRWRWVPFVEAGVSSERGEDGHWITGPVIEIELPIFNRGQARLARLESQAAEAHYEVRTLDVAIPNEVRAAKARLAAARDGARRAMEKITPLRAEITGLDQREYNYMLKDSYALLKSKREEFAAQSGAAEALRDYWLALVALQRAAGGSFAAPNSPGARQTSAPEAGNAEGMEHHHHGQP